jgi:hypothetical protein
VITETTPKHSVADFQWMLDNIAWLSDKENIDLRVVSPVNVVCEEEHYLPPILSWEIERCGHPVLPADETQTWPLVERTNLAELYRLVLERGYVVGGFQKDNYPELVGKFHGWVDDLTTGECKCRIVGTEKLPLEKEAA